MTGTTATRLRAAFGAAAITATLLASGVGPASAAASGAASAHHDGGTAKAHTKHAGKGSTKHEGKGGTKHDGKAGKLAKAKAQTDAAFARLLKRAGGLSESAAAAANINADRAHLAGLTSVADVHALHPDNYQQVINWLKQADRLALSVEAPDASVTDAITDAVTQLLSVTATSDRADLRSAKRLLAQLERLVEATVDTTGDDSTDPTDDTTDDTTDPGAGGDPSGV